MADRHDGSFPHRGRPKKRRNAGGANRLNRTETVYVCRFVVRPNQLYPTMIHPIRTTLTAAAACGLLFSAFATPALAAPKDYQFTGPITAMTDTTFTVVKGKETWDFAKDADTKLPEGAKVGDKVTVHYVMHATVVEASAAAAPTKEKAPKKDKAPAAAAAASPKA